MRRFLTVLNAPELDPLPDSLNSRLARHPRVVVVGSSNTDLVIRSARVPKPGETMLGGEFEIHPGGKGANQAVAAARLGARVEFIGCIGRDPFGETACAGLQKEGISLRHTTRIGTVSSGVALILVGAEGENLISVARSSNDRLTPAHVRRAAPSIRRAGLLLAQLEVPLPAVTEAVRIAFRAGVRVILNPAPGRPLPRTLLRQVWMITPNESELSLLTGLPTQTPAQLVRAARRLLASGPREVLITCGARGACHVTPDATRFEPAPKVRAIDTTGAGDAYAAGFLTACSADAKRNR